MISPTEPRPRWGFLGGCRHQRRACNVTRRSVDYIRNWPVDRVPARVWRSRIHFLSTAPSLKTTTFPINTPALSLLKSPSRLAHLAARRTGAGWTSHAEAPSPMPAAEPKNSPRLSAAFPPPTIDGERWGQRVLKCCQRARRFVFAAKLQARRVSPQADAGTD